MLIKGENLGIHKICHYVMLNYSFFLENNVQLVSEVLTARKEHCGTVIFSVQRGRDQAKPVTMYIN